MRPNSKPKKAHLVYTRPPKSPHTKDVTQKGPLFLQVNKKMKRALDSFCILVSLLIAYLLLTLSRL